MMHSCFFLKMFRKIYILNLHRYKKKIRMLNLPSKAPLTWEAWEDFKIPECYQKLHSGAQYLRYIMHVLRAVDLDPHGSAFIFPPGSGSRRENLCTKN